jgi:predicted AlkP superfamily pyrophosphatase or phosphodiesterase
MPEAADYIKASPTLILLFYPYNKEGFLLCHKNTPPLAMESIKFFATRDYNKTIMLYY